MRSEVSVDQSSEKEEPYKRCGTNNAQKTSNHEQTIENSLQNSDKKEPILQPVKPNSNISDDNKQIQVTKKPIGQTITDNQIPLIENNNDSPLEYSFCDNLNIRSKTTFENSSSRAYNQKYEISKHPSYASQKIINEGASQIFSNKNSFCSSGLIVDNDLPVFNNTQNVKLENKKKYHFEFKDNVKFNKIILRSLLMFYVQGCKACFIIEDQKQFNDV